jgi:hypothetical protein
MSAALAVAAEAGDVGALIADDDWECAYANVRTALRLMDLDTAFAYLADKHPCELARCNARYPEIFFGDVPY